MQNAVWYLKLQKTLCVIKVQWPDTKQPKCTNWPRWGSEQLLSLWQSSGGIGKHTQLWDVYVPLPLVYLHCIYSMTPSCPCTMCISTGCTLDELALCLYIQATKTNSWFLQWLWWVEKHHKIKITSLHVLELTYKLSLTFLQWLYLLFLTALSNMFSPITCVSAAK